jgi:hypothetical protein
MYAGLPTQAPVCVRLSPPASAIAFAIPKSVNTACPPRQHDVAGLEVPVNHPVLVRVRQRLRDIPGDSEGLVNRQLSGIPEATVERLPFHVGHHEVERLTRLPGVQQGQYVRVLQAGGEANLLFETLGQHPGRELGTNGLDRHLAVVPGVLRQIYDPHPALTEDSEQLVPLA